MPDPTPPVPVQLAVQLAPDQEIGVFGDFASVWHTPNSFVLDFISVKQPAHPVMGPDGAIQPGPQLLEARVAARVRIPSEQIFPLMAALRTQGDAWLAETGRSEPPSNWVSGNQDS